VLAHPGEGAGVLIAEHALDLPDEVSLLEKAPPCDDKSLIHFLRLFLQLIQAPSTEMDSLRREGNAGSH
jgi:hypothetical protein